MTLRLAVRALLTRPVRTAVLACGFGLGISVMAALLGVGEVILEQARSPALVGGGDVVVSGMLGFVGSARFVMSSVLSSPPLAGRVAAVSPSVSSSLYLVHRGRVSRIRVHGGIPSLERAVGDPVTSGITAWTDAAQDRTWTSPDPGDVLRAMDRFHPIPQAPARAGSWAEWLYFNGRSEDGSTRFYLTFLVGPRTSSGRRLGAVRLQLERGTAVSSHSATAEVSESSILARAPDLDIGPCRVRLEGLTYRIDLDLPGNGESPPVLGSIEIRAVAGRSMPPFAIRGAAGWVSGYVVPVLSGQLEASLRIGEETLTLERGLGYHDHNWGFWEGVRWQWGQVAHEGLSFVYGRIYPPPDAADPDRIPGFLGVLGPEGPLGFATHVTIDEDPETAGVSTADGPETSGAAPPRTIRVGAHGPGIDLTMEGQVESVLRTQMGNPFARDEQGGAAASSMVRGSRGEMSFLQLRARFHVTGRVAGRDVDFTSLGSAETFRGE